MSQALLRRITGAESDDGVVISVEVDGVVHSLDPTASSVWRIADGTKNVQSAARELGLDQRTIWLAIDRLADLGLLAVRPTPPGADNVVVPLASSTTRRRVLQLGLAAATAAGSVIAASGVASAQSAEQKELREKARSEQKAKQAEKKSK